jgi:hypothetical protein
VSIEEEAWLSRVVVVSAADARGRCLRPFVRVATRNVRFLLNRAETGPFIARSVFPSARVTVKQMDDRLQGRLAQKEGGEFELSAFLA